MFSVTPAGRLWEANLFLDVLRNILRSCLATALVIRAGYSPFQLCASPSLLGLILVSTGIVQRVTAPAYQLRLPLVACLQSGPISATGWKCKDIGRQTMSTDLICAIPGHWLAIEAGLLAVTIHSRSNFSLFSLDAMMLECLMV